MAKHNAQPVALQIGAGKIGRGFMGELFQAAGCHIVFDDIDAPLVRALAEARAYDLHHITNERDDVVRIAGFDVADGNDPGAVAEAVADADVVCTAVGARCLPDVAPVLADGLARRAARTEAPLTVIVCENLPRPGRRLRDLVREALERLRAQGRARALTGDTLETRFGFAGAVVSRAVPAPPEEGRRRGPLWLACAPVPGILVDAAAVRGPLPPLPDLHAVDNFTAHQQRKLLVHNMSHAVCAYLGYQAGHALLWQAMEDPAVAETVRSAMDEAGRALCTRFGLDPQEQRAYEDDLDRRYRNRPLGDQVARVAADPLRKLGPEDRLIGAARLCLEEGVEPTHVLRGIRAALAYDAPDDPSAVRLQQMLTEHGRAHVLKAVCGLADGDPLLARLIEPVPPNEA